ncbi:MAG: hypothetical protein OEL53_09615 [Rhodospirillales bacterium]|nr:hypothetical protein [Rhodospirillales bacterium]
MRLIALALFLIFMALFLRIAVMFPFPKDNLFVSIDRPEMILKPLPKPGVNLLHDKALAGYRGTGISVNAFGVEELSAMASVPVTDWFLVVRVPTQEAFEAVDTTLIFAFRAAVPCRRA